MTEEELAAIEALSTKRHVEGAHCVATRRTVYQLVAEVRRLRSLPVIETCGACYHLGLKSAAKSPTFTCTKAKRDVYDTPSSEARKPPVPPDWCPIRNRPLTSVVK